MRFRLSRTTFVSSTMEKATLDDVEPMPYDTDLHSDRRDLTDPLSLANVAIVQYALAPGERLSGAVHTHMDQEEIFVVLDGEITFETLRRRSSSRRARRSGSPPVSSSPGTTRVTASVTHSPSVRLVTARTCASPASPSTRTSPVQAAVTTTCDSARTAWSVPSAGRQRPCDRRWPAAPTGRSRIRAWLVHHRTRKPSSPFGSL